MIGQVDGGTIDAIFLTEQGDYDAQQDHAGAQRTELHTEFGDMYAREIESFSNSILTGSPLLAPGEDGINGVNLANSSQLSAWTGREVSNPCDPEEYAAELNKLIEAEGKFPVRE